MFAAFPPLDDCHSSRYGKVVLAINREQPGLAEAWGISRYDTTSLNRC